MRSRWMTLPLLAFTAYLAVLTTALWWSVSHHPKPAAAEPPPPDRALTKSIPRVESISMKRLTTERAEDAALDASRAAERAVAAIPTPTPTPTPEPVTAAPEPSVNAQPSQAQRSSGLPSLLAFIRDHESGGNYSAYNASGCEGYGCGGAYQLHAAYAATWAARAGFPGLSGQAQNWSPEVQDAVALDLFYSTNPDGAHWCNWVDYC